MQELATIVFGDSIFRGMRVGEVNNEIKNRRNAFSPVQIWEKFHIHYVNATLESGNYDTAVVHFGVNDLMQKLLIKSDKVDNLMENIRKTAVKCMS